MQIEQLEDRIRQAFPGSDVVVLDSTGTSNHFEVRIASPHFSALTRIQQHKSVMDLFQTELASGEVHALEIKTIVKT